MIDLHPKAEYDSFGNRGLQPTISYNPTQNPSFPNSLKGGNVTSRIQILNNRVTSGHFRQIIQYGNGTKNPTTVWMSDGTTPSGNLTGVKGDMCYNGPSGHSFWCGGTTTWTQI